jgi:UDP-N-acetylmuramyl pentapeptide synthase
LRTIANVVGGSPHDGDPDTLVTGPACYDSRLIEPEGLFVAAALVDRADDLAVVGITGSVGKAVTKDLLGSTVAPPGSQNNEIGLPATVALPQQRRPGVRGSHAGQ